MSKDNPDKSDDIEIEGALSPKTRDIDDDEEIDESTSEVNLDEDLFAGNIRVDESDEDEEDPEEKVEEELVSDYIDFNWSEQWSGVKNKINKAGNGDEQARKDLSAAPKRVKDYFLYNPIPKDTLLDILIPATLVIYSFIVLILSFGIGGAIFTEPNRLADIFILDTLLMILAVFIFIYTRQRSDLTNISRVDIIRRRSRALLFVAHLIPSAIVGWFIYARFTGGTDTLYTTVNAFYNILAYWEGVLPNVLNSVGYFIWNVTPIGITVQEVAVVMFVSGIMGSIPFILAMAKVLFIAINVSSETEEESKDLMDAVKGLEDDRPLPEDRELLEENEDEEDEEDEIDKYEDVDEESLDLLDGVRDKLITYEEPDDLLETHDEFKMTEYNDKYVEVDRYWLNEPYSYAVILYYEEEDDYRYFAVEPQLGDEEKELYREFRDRLDTAIRSESVDSEYEEDMLDEKKLEILEEQVFKIATEYNIELSDLSLQKIMYYVERDYVGYKHIDVLMNDTNVEDISCVGPGEPVWINHSVYENMVTNIQFEKYDLQRFINELAQRSGEQISAASPLQDATLPDGSRAQLSLGDDITTDGSTFTIRQFQDVPFTPVDLLRTETFSAEQMAYLWLAIQNNKSLIFAGGTASGKTTSMNAMSLFIPPKSKVVTLEDTREITLPHNNWIPGKTREGTSQGEGATDAITMYNLLESALRQRPEYLVVGEVRGEEAQTLFQAMSTGHTTYSTMHADTVKEAIYRLKNDPINVPERMINVLDIIAIQRRFIYEGKAVRKNINITEISGTESNERSHTLRKVFERDERFESRWNDNTQDSQVLKSIREENNWSPKELDNELKRRKEVLQYLQEEDVYHFKKVTKVIQKYMGESDKERVMEQIRNGTLDPDEVEDITKIDLSEIKEMRHKDKTEEIMRNSQSNIKKI